MLHLKPYVTDIVAKALLHDMPGIENVSMTTNALLLPQNLDYLVSKLD